VGTIENRDKLGILLKREVKTERLAAKYFCLPPLTSTRFLSIYSFSKPISVLLVPPPSIKIRIPEKSNEHLTHVKSDHTCLYLGHFGPVILSADAKAGNVVVVVVVEEETLLIDVCDLFGVSWSVRRVAKKSGS
jgi:hypothetical protein